MAFTLITADNKTTIKKEIADILKISAKDDILFILDENRRIIIRRYPTPLRLEEKFLSSAKVGERIFGKERETEFRIHVSKDVIDILEVDKDRKILWILDENGNIILRNTFLFSKCAIDILNQDTSAMIIFLTKISTAGLTTIPKEVLDILDIDIGDTIAFIIDKFGNITVNVAPLSNELLGETKIYDAYKIYFSIEVREKLKVDIGDNILWIFDENGNVIIKNTILPNTCH